MKHLKNIVCLQVIFMALFFLFAGKQTTQACTFDKPIPTEFSQEGLRLLAFIQPETAHHVVSHIKTFSFSVARLADYFESVMVRSVALKAGKKLLSQDINRCETVSLLIFPYHLFW